MSNRDDIFQFQELSIKNYRLVNPDSNFDNNLPIESLGKGGSGIVFKALQEQLTKVLKLTFAD